MSIFTQLYAVFWLIFCLYSYWKKFRPSFSANDENMDDNPDYDEMLDSLMDLQKFVSSSFIEKMSTLIFLGLIVIDIIGFILVYTCVNWRPWQWNVYYAVIALTLYLFCVNFIHERHILKTLLYSNKSYQTLRRYLAFYKTSSLTYNLDELSASGKILAALYLFLTAFF